MVAGLSLATLLKIRPFDLMLKRLYKMVSKVIPLDITHVLALELGRTTTSEHGGSHHDRLSKSTRTINNKNAVCRVLSAEQLSKWVSYDDNDLNLHAVQAVDQQSIVCIGAFIDDELAGYTFFCSSPVKPENNSGGQKFNGIGLTFPHHVRYLYKAYVVAAYRGRGVATAILSYAVSYYKSVEVSHLVTTTDWTNTAFLRTLDKAQFEKQAMAAEWVIAGKHFFFIPNALVVQTRPTDNDGAAMSEIHAIRLSRPD